jgi:hypothetical protein
LSKGSEGEWKDPDTASFAVPIQGVLTRSRLVKGKDEIG